MGSSFANAIMDVATLGSSYQQRKAAKEQTNAANAMAAAMEKQPTIATSQIAQQQTQNTQQTEQNINTQTRRRYTINKTVNNRPSLNSGILTGRKTLG